MWWEEYQINDTFLVVELEVGELSMDCASWWTMEEEEQVIG